MYPCMPMPRPARGVWIEIFDIPPSFYFGTVTPREGRVIEIGAYRLASGQLTSRPARGMWIEILCAATEDATAVSRLARGVWIEIVNVMESRIGSLVTPRKRRVD